MVAGGEMMSQLEGLEASRQACINEEVAGDEAELPGFTEVLGVAPFDGERQWSEN
jgi:hypothetical protein